MPISGIHLHTQNGFFLSVIDAMENFSGVTIHNKNEDFSRVILTLETETVEHQEEAFMQIQKTKGVVSADLIYLYNDEEQETI